MANSGGADLDGARGGGAGRALAGAARPQAPALYDGLQIKHLNELINLLCYGGAILGLRTWH
jgi:hypothetical protein